MVAGPVPGTELGDVFDVADAVVVGPLGDHDVGADFGKHSAHRVAAASTVGSR